MGGNLDLVALRKDGREVPVDISLSPFETAGGWLIAASMRDVSDRKKATSELRNALAEVECLRDELRRGKPLSAAGTPDCATASRSLSAGVMCCSFCLPRLTKWPPPTPTC